MTTSTEQTTGVVDCSVLTEQRTPLGERLQEDARVRAWEVALRSDAQTWQARLSMQADGRRAFPSIFDPDGLPPGWVLRAHHSHQERNRYRTTVRCLVTAAGGWVLLNHNVTTGVSAEMTTTINDYAPTLAALYARMREDVEAPTATRSRLAELVEQMTREFIAAHYNLTDPTEAAEATLVALGGRPQLMPTALA